MLRKMYSPTNKQDNRRIKTLMEEIKNDLLKSNQAKKYMNIKSYTNIRPLSGNKNKINIKIPQSNLNNIVNDSDIRKIIKEEFNILISSYQSEVNNNIKNLDNKINNISNDINKDITNINQKIQELNESLENINNINDINN